MAITLGTDSYLSVADADSYHSDRGNTTWAAEAAGNKEIALRTASFWIDDWFKGRWKGVAVYEETKLAWPRYSVQDEEGRNITGTPKAVKHAVAEMALKSLSGELSPDLAAGGLTKNIHLGELGKTFFEGSDPHKYYTMVERILSGLLVVNNVNIKLVRM